MVRKLSMIAVLTATCQFALADKVFDDALAKAKKGDAAAQYTVGASYQYGNNGAQQDYAQAKDWLTKSAEKGNADAKYGLGVAYEFGQGVPQNYTKAAEWYEKASAQNQLNAIYRLGILYENGRGVKQDYKKALSLYNKAVEKGFTVAKTDADALTQKIAAQEAASKAEKTGKKK